jgi:hypothetical protein
VEEEKMHSAEEMKFWSARFAEHCAILESSLPPQSGWSGALKASKTEWAAVPKDFVRSTESLMRLKEQIRASIVRDRIIQQPQLDEMVQTITHMLEEAEFAKDYVVGNVDVQAHRNFWRMEAAQHLAIASRATGNAVLGGFSKAVAMASDKELIVVYREAMEALKAVAGSDVGIAHEVLESLHGIKMLESLESRHSLAVGTRL